MNVAQRTEQLYQEQAREFKNFAMRYYSTFGWTVTEVDNFLKVTNVLNHTRWVLCVARPHETEIDLKTFKDQIQENFTIVAPEFSRPYSFKGTKSYAYRTETASGITFYHFSPRG